MGHPPYDNINTEYTKYGSFEVNVIITCNNRAPPRTFNQDVIAITNTFRGFIEVHRNSRTMKVTMPNACVKFCIACATFTCDCTSSWTKKLQLYTRLSIPGSTTMIVGTYKYINWTKMSAIQSSNGCYSKYNKHFNWKLLWIHNKNSICKVSVEPTWYEEASVRACLI